MPWKDPEKRRAAQRRRAQTPAEKERKRAWYQAHKAQQRAKQLTRRAANREAYLAYMGAYNAAHREERRAYGKRYRETHREERRIYQRAYHKAHPEVVKASFHRRRAQQAAAGKNDLTAHQWKEIKAHYDHRCVYCGRKMSRLTMDHILPLSKGGEHTFTNIVPACKACNDRKYTGAPLVPVQPLLVLPTGGR